MTIDSFPGVSSLVIVAPASEPRTIWRAYAAVDAYFWSEVSNFSTVICAISYGFGNTTKFILFLNSAGSFKSIKNPPSPRALSGFFLALIN